MARKIRIMATVLLGAWTTLGCGANAANERPVAAASSPSAEDDDATAGLMEHHRHHHHGGVTLLIAMSLDTLGVSPEQQAAVEKIRGDLHARMEPAHIAEQKVVETLAEGLASGTIDVAKVDAAIARVTAAAAALHDASAEALNELHSVLTPPQRAALVDKVEAHWAVWQKANAEETAATKPEDSHLAALTPELGLTTEQVDRIRAGLGEGMKTVPRLDPEEIRTHIRAFGDAFRSDTFDAKKLTAASVANAHMVAWGASHSAHFLETVGAVLTPEQRAKLAQMLREHATHNPSAQANP